MNNCKGIPRFPTRKTTGYKEAAVPDALFKNIEIVGINHVRKVNLSNPISSFENTIS